MSSPSALDSWLRDLGEVELAGLLEGRADVLYGVKPRSVAELAVRLWHPTSLVSALRAMPLPVLQLLEAAQVVGDGSPRTDIAGFSNRHRGFPRRCCHLLACSSVKTHAVDRQLPVRISYELATGSVTQRTIGSLEMIGDSIFAWCYLRSDTRVFTASRIRSVSAL